MTRNEHLKFCQQCLNRKFDVQHGILCNLSGDKANFESECSNFSKDETVVPKDYALQYTQDANQESGQKDMLIGAAWCIGGIAATVADFGYVFWGAIIFGAIQFIKGATNS